MGIKEKVNELMNLGENMRQMILLCYVKDWVYGSISFHLERVKDITRTKKEKRYFL